MNGEPRKLTGGKGVLAGEGGEDDLHPLPIQKRATMGAVAKSVIKSVNRKKEVCVSD